MARLKSGIEVDKTDLANINSLMGKLEDLGGDVVPVFKRTSDDVVDEMQRYAPYDTGRLHHNIEGRVWLDSLGNVNIEFESEAIDPVTRIDYAPLQEFGTLEIRERPYFFPAIRGAAQTLIKRLDQAIKSIIRKGK